MRTGFRQTPTGLWLPEQTGLQPVAPLYHGSMTYIDHKSVFPGEPDDFPEFKRVVRSLSRTDALLWCARLNILVSDATTIDRDNVHAYCVSTFFGRPDEIERLNAFAKPRGGRDSIEVFFRAQLLELLRWIALLCGDHPYDGRTFESADVRRNFARAALMASDVWAYRAYRDEFNKPGPIEQVRKEILAAVRAANIETAESLHPIFAVARGASLFSDRLFRDAEARALFAQNAGMDIDDYLAMTAQVAVNGLGRGAEAVDNPDKCGMWNMAAYENAPAPLRDASRIYFARESQTIEELRRSLWAGRIDATEENAPAFNLQPLRERPILRTASGRAIIIDPRLFVDRVTIGPLFQVLSACGRDMKRREHIISMFGDTFQSYVTDTFDRMYPTTPGLVRRFVANPREKTNPSDEIADGLLAGARTIALMEIKMALGFADSALLGSTASSEYLAYIRKRYVVTEANASGKQTPKGVGQIARNIKNLADGTWRSDDMELSGIERILTVLVIHDVHLDAPLHSLLLAQEFAAQLGHTQPIDGQDMACGRFRVAHLIVLTIDDLEALETSCKNFALLECLEDYSRDCPDRMMSLHNYLALSPKYRDKLRHNAALASRSLDVLEHCKSKLFLSDENWDQPDATASSTPDSADPADGEP